MVSNISDPKPDIVIIGGGVVGLWSAWVAARRGLRVQLMEKRTLTSGASGGMLGSLMPHHPGGWSEKKQFQLDGLMSLPDWVGALEAETGTPCGYGRVGRIQPIGHPEKRRQSQAWVDGARKHWPQGIDWSIEDDHPADGWADDIAAHGWNVDTLSARINPRALTGALSAWVRNDPNIEVLEGVVCEVLPNETPTILAAGLGSFSLIDAEQPQRIGKGVKGQGALLQPKRAIDPDMPLIYDNGTYVIAHADGTIAVGSTSENSFEHPTSTDEKLDAVIDDARRICPPLRDAEIIERWAGVRPKAGKPDPLLGLLPDFDRVLVATGGFKITFAIAHLMAEHAVASLCGEDTEIPDAFLPVNRLRLKPDM